MTYDKIIATGGIGTGMLFLSGQQETLGRSESRSVTLSPAKDYCKQQIVLYYTAALLRETIPVYPIGYVGNDSMGDSILEEMRRQDGCHLYIPKSGRSDDHQCLPSVSGQRDVQLYSG